MKNFFGFLLVAFLFFGYYKGKTEDFFPIQKDYKWGSLKVRLSPYGGVDLEEFDDGLVSPYFLALWFTPNKKNKGLVRIKDLKLLNKERIEFHIANIEEQFKLNSLGNYGNGFVFRDLDLPYIEHSVLVEFEIEDKGGIQKEKSSFRLEKDYEEYYGNKIWSALMGI